MASSWNRLCKGRQPCQRPLSTAECPSGVPEDSTTLNSRICQCAECRTPMYDQATTFQTGTTCNLSAPQRMVTACYITIKHSMTEQRRVLSGHCGTGPSTCLS